jgi:hypothetical protein
MGWRSRVMVVAYPLEGLVRHLKGYSAIKVYISQANQGSTVRLRIRGLTQTVSSQ